mmetsp:Transcript_594/g.1035  ORF Transcript_594/g.1035 Transcript_594/m.1035 type:complete len:245 (+) Transcript_594:203-937(+)
MSSPANHQHISFLALPAARFQNFRVSEHLMGRSKPAQTNVKAHSACRILLAPLGRQEARSRARGSKTPSPHGRLKGFKILAAEIRDISVRTCTYVYQTCCTLANTWLFCSVSSSNLAAPPGQLGGFSSQAKHLAPQWCQLIQGPCLLDFARNDPCPRLPPPLTCLRPAKPLDKLRHATLRAVIRLRAVHHTLIPDQKTPFSQRDSTRQPTDGVNVGKFVRAAASFTWYHPIAAAMATLARQVAR